MKDYNENIYEFLEALKKYLSDKGIIDLNSLEWHNSGQLWLSLLTGSGLLIKIVPLKDDEEFEENVISIIKELIEEIKNLKMKKEDVIALLSEKLKEAFEKSQDRPDQYVVAYFRVKDDSLIGYHASTFCQVTDDIFDGKRYSGDNPYEQLAIISKNLKYILRNDHKGMFAELNNKIKDEDFGGLAPEDIYMDAIYLAKGMPKQNFKMTIINNNE